MKKSSISKYCKLATVLLINAMPVWVTIRITTAADVNSDFIGFGLMMMFFFFLGFNVWALIVFFLTKLIQRVWLRDTLFYLLLLLFLFSPLFMGILGGRMNKVR